MKTFKMPTLIAEVSLGTIPNIKLFAQLPNCQKLLGGFVGGWDFFKEKGENIKAIRYDSDLCHF